MAAVLQDHRNTIEHVLGAIKPGWFMNLVSIEEGRSYFICPDASIQTWLAQLLDVAFEDDIAKAERMWLRKEIIKQDLTRMSGLPT